MLQSRIAMKNKTYNYLTGALAFFLIVGCVVPGQGDDGQSVAERERKYTFSQVEQFKVRFKEQSDLGLPNDTTHLVEFGQRICETIDANDGDVDGTMNLFREGAADETDWGLTSDVSKAATLTLCTEYRDPYTAWVAAK